MLSFSDIQRRKEALSHLTDTFTAVLGFVTLARSEMAGERRAAFLREASQQADRLRDIAGGDLLLVVSRDRPQLREWLHRVFGDAPGVKIIMDRRHADGPWTDTDRRRLDLSEELNRVGVGIGRPYHTALPAKAEVTTRLNAE